MLRSSLTLLVITLGTFAALSPAVVAPRVAQAQEPTPVAPQAEEAAEMVTTASGLKYRVVVKGEGDDRPRVGDDVTVHYTGKLDSGKVFDSSRTKGRPATFTVGRLIPGWNEGLQLMTVGTKLELEIPSELGYGPGGMGRDIPPNATLHFEVELLAIKHMPVFTKPSAEAQTTTESGLKLEELAAGAGDTPVETDGVEMKFAFWTSTGELLGCTEKQGENLKGAISSLQVPFLKEAALLMKIGSKYRFEVPGKLGFGERGKQLPNNGVTVWELELVRIAKPLPIPTFELPADDQLTKTASGLQYKVIDAGDDAGASPKLGEFVTVHYCGWLTDGTKFDSSFERGFEASFRLGQVIPGWNEGLQLMKPGAKYLFVIPSNLAYGPKGQGPVIGPNATLVFRVEYLRAGK